MGSAQQRRWTATARVLGLGWAALSALPAGAAELRGWPVRLEGGISTSNPAVGDVNGDGTLEVVIAAGLSLHVLGKHGAELEGWPLALKETRKKQDDMPSRSDFPGSATLCDLDKNGAMEIALLSLDNKLHVLDGAAKEWPGFPVEGGGLWATAPACADLDGDGAPELVWAGQDGVLRAVTAQGKPAAGFPVADLRLAEGLVAVGDFNAQPGVEVAVGTMDGQAQVLGRTAKGWVNVPGFPVKTQFTVSGGPVMADMDSDGQVELLFGSQDFRIFAVRGDGAMLPSFPVQTDYRIYAQPAVGDLDGDGKNDLVVGGGDGRIYALKSDGSAARGWPVPGTGRIIASAALGDLDSDGTQEVVVPGGDGRLHVMRGDGTPFGGFPLAPGGGLNSAPLIADLDQDGRLEVLIGTGTGYVHAYTFQNLAQVKKPTIAWPTAGHDSGRVSRTRPNPALFLNAAVMPVGARTDDDLKVAYQHVDLDGDPEKDTQIRWFRNGAAVPELNNKPTVPKDLTRKNEKWHYTLQEGVDFATYAQGKGARITTSPVLVIQNTPPTTAQVSVLPATPDTLAELEVRIDKPSTDADGDPILYAYRWFRSREPVLDLPLTATRVAPARTTKGEQWRVVVIPSDGQAEGEHASAQVTILNTAPSAFELSLLPEKPGAAQALNTTITKPSTDPDNDPVTYTYAWVLDDKPVPFPEPRTTFPALAARKGQTITLTVTPRDGETTGPTFKRSATWVNTAPLLPTPRVWPPQPRTEDALWAGVGQPAQDWDADNVTYTFRWEREGQALAPAQGTTVGPEQTQRGQKFALYATPHDQDGPGPEARMELAIADTPPGQPVLVLDPPVAQAGQTIRVVVKTEAPDVDQDKITYRIKWLRDGQDATSAAKGMQVPVGVLKKNQVWQAVVTAFDGELEGAPTGSLQLKVADTPPTAPTVALEPAAPQTADVIRVKIAKHAADVDQDPVAYRYRWFVDGMQQDLPPTASELPADRTVRGQVWRVEVTPVADGAEGAMAAAEVTVVNTPPGAPVVAIEPAQPVGREPLRAVVKTAPQDLDGDPVRVTFKWFRGGKDSGLTGPVVPAGRIKKGEVWSVQADTFDGLASGASAKAEVTVINQPPLPPVLALGPQVLRVTDALDVRVTTAAADPDGDAVKLAWAWQVNGKDVAAWANKTKLAKGDLKKNQRVSLTVTPDDGTAKGVPVQAAWQVENTAPTAPTVAFAKTPVAAPEALSVVLATQSTDADADKLTYRYRFFRNGERVALADNVSKIPSAMVVKGDRWLVEVVAFDGQAESPPASAEAQVVNAAPTAPVVAFANPKATVTDVLEVVVQKQGTDADGDKLSHHHVYTLNGKRVDLPPATRRIPKALLKKGDVWKVEVVAHDGALKSPPVTAEAKVANSVPTAPAVAFTMKEGWPGVRLDVQVNAPSMDADGDPLTYRYKFFQNGSPLNRPDESSPTVQGNQVRAGDKWRVQVSAWDGEVASAPATADVKVAVPPVPPKPKKDAAGKDIPPPPPPAPPEPPALVAPPASPPRVVDAQEAPGLEPQVPEQVVPPRAVCSVGAAHAPPLAGDALTAQLKWEGKAPQEAAVQWLRNVQKAPQAKGAEVPASVIKKGEIWRAVVQDRGQLRGACQDVVVADTPPAAPKVALEPAALLTGQELRVRVVEPSVDVDADKVTYRHLWFLNGHPQPWPDTTDRVPAAQVRKGDTWRVQVTPVADGRPGAPAAVETRVLNALPTAPVLRVEPATPKAGQALQAWVVTPAQDVDRDVLDLAWTWLRAGKPVPDITGPHVPPGVVKKGETWTVQLSAHDGVGPGPAGTAEVTVQNTPSGAPVLGAGPAVIATGVPIKVGVTRAAVDPDGDPTTLEWAWRVDGKVKTTWAGLQEIAPQELHKNQRVHLDVRALDPSPGAWTSVEVAIRNTPPGAPVVAFESAAVPVTQALKVLVQTPAVDPDGDAVTYRHRFYRNGVRVSGAEADPVVPVSQLKKGDQWDAEVVAFDGETEGPGAWAHAVVVNTAPLPPVLQVTPAAPTTLDPLTCQVQPGADPDRDAPLYRVQWLRNGVETPLMPAGALPHEATHKGETWACRAVQWDGQAFSGVAESAPVTVVNSAPPPPAVVVLPQAPRVGEPLRCRVEGESADADGDAVAYTFFWEKNGKPQAGLDAAWEVPGSQVKRGDAWACWANASDGTLESGPKAPRAKVQVGNTPPTAPVVEVRPASPRQGEDIRCEVTGTSQDPDGDKVGYRVEWQKNGQLQGFAPTQLVVEGRNTAQGQVWRCVLTAFDGKQDSSPGRSPPVTIGEPRGDAR